MTHPIATLNCRQVREFDRAAAEEFGVPGRVLMENAGREAMRCLSTRNENGLPVLILAGKGNNGGDGFVVARHLDGAGVACTVLVAATADQLVGEAAANLRAIQSAGLRVEFLPGNASLEEITAVFKDCAADAGWIVDALLGIGITGDPRSPVDSLIRLANHAPAKRMAIDVPSGLDADTGAAGEPTFQAEVTCTFVAAKPGLLVESAAAYVGDLEVASIGAPRMLRQRFGLD